MSAATLESKLRSWKKLPIEVHSWHVEEGYDSTGDFAFWVWITVKDEDLSKENRTKIRELVKEKVRKLEPASVPWVYVRFRGTSELATP